MSRSAASGCVSSFFFYAQQSVRHHVNTLLPGTSGRLIGYNPYDKNAEPEASCSPCYDAIKDEHFVEMIRASFDGDISEENLTAILKKVPHIFVYGEALVFAFRHQRTS